MEQWKMGRKEYNGKECRWGATDDGLDAFGWMKMRWYWRRIVRWQSLGETCQRSWSWTRHVYGMFVRGMRMILQIHKYSEDFQDQNDSGNYTHTVCAGTLVVNWYGVLIVTTRKDSREEERVHEELRLFGWISQKWNTVRPSRLASSATWDGWRTNQ